MSYYEKVGAGLDHDVRIDPSLYKVIGVKGDFDENDKPIGVDWILLDLNCQKMNKYLDKEKDRENKQKKLVKKQKEVKKAKKAVEGAKQDKRSGWKRDYMSRLNSLLKSRNGNSLR